MHMSARPRPIAWHAQGILAILLFAAVTTGCSNPAAISGDTNSVTVNALWVGANADGSPASGTEPITVTVSVGDPSRGFELDLQTQRDQGAGPAWDAAAWSASAAATLATSRDPRTLNISYSITGAIDGPSAGGLMTVAVAAAIRNQQPRPGVAMTGTISPDGSIGIVGGILDKIKAAERAGFETVVIPQAGTEISLPAKSSSVDAVKFGESIGVRVVPVSTLGQAYEEVVGGWPAEPEAAPSAIDPPIVDFLHNRTKSYTKAAKKVLSASAKTPDSSQLRRLRQQTKAAIAQSKQLSAAARTSEAYGSAASAMSLGAALESGSNQTASARPDSAVAVENAQAQTAVAKRSVELAKQAPTQLEQVTARPDSLSWGTDAIAQLRISANQLSKLPGDRDNTSALATVAAVDAQARVEGTDLGTDAMSVASLTGLKPVPADVDQYVSGWTAFLRQAGDAAVNYFEKVLGPTGDALQRLESVDITYATAIGYQRTLREAELADSQQARAALLFAAASSFYVSGAHLVAQAGSLSASRTDPLGVGINVNQDALAAATANAASATDASLAEAAAAGLDTSYLRWNQQWAHAQANGTVGTGTDRARTRGLQYLWYTYVSSQILLQLDQVEPPQPS